MAASGKYVHLTGKMRARQEFAGVTPIPHPLRTDFIDDGDLKAISVELDRNGIPVFEDATATAKTDEQALY